MIRNFLENLKRLRVFHPFLFAFYPILFAYAQNISYLSIREVTRPLGVVLCATTVLFLALRQITKDWDRAGFIASIWLFATLNYGYYTYLPRNIAFLGLQINRHVLLLAFWVTFISLVTHEWVWKRVRPRYMTQYLNLLALISVAFPLRLILPYFSNPFYSVTDIPQLPPIETVQTHWNQRPDIYFIILDSYARADVLQEIYHYDNTPFIEFLENRGFFVADQAFSNYLFSDFSLTSTLNAAYLDFLAPSPIRNHSDRTPLVQNLKPNRVFQFLSEIGYQIVVVGSDLTYQDFSETDILLKPDYTPFTPFEIVLLQNSIAWMPHELIDNQKGLILPGYDSHRQRIIYQFAAIPDLVEMPGPKIVFAHILIPHPPFVFGPDGEEITTDRHFTLAEDGNKFPGTDQEYIAGYVDQLHYTNQLTRNLVERLLLDSPQPPIIILQADHGPRLFLDWSSFEDSCIHEHSSILSAYYFPDLSQVSLYPSITPVNTFRMIFDTYFGTDLGLLEDRAFVSGAQIYQFSEISDVIAVPCKEPDMK